MRDYARLMIVLAAVALTAIGCAARKTARKPAPNLAIVRADSQVRRVAAANTAFGFRLLGRLTREKPNENVFFSSFSVSDALTMTLNGAGGATRRDMANTLRLQGMALDSINRANGLLLPSLENPDPQVEIRVANALWAPRGVVFNRDFQARCRRFYDADASNLDFADPSAARTINGWVSDQTRGKITDIESPPDLVLATAVLTNAVYFHGKWASPFNKAQTQNSPFTLAGGKHKTLPLMSQEGVFPYTENKQFQAVSLPYGQGRMSLYVFLPRAGVGLEGLLKTLDALAWDRQIVRMHPRDLTIILPRFKVNYDAMLNAPLISLGMGRAFGPGADFSPMGLGGSRISQVKHKAVIEVDEEGTVAAAATAVIMTSEAARPEPQTVVRVDHPFFCAIRDNATGTLLFLGAIGDPH